MKINKLYLILSLATALMLIFSFPNFIEYGIKYHTWFLAWFAFVPLFAVMIKAENSKQAFLYGYLSGSIFYLGSFYWLCFVKVMGIFAYVCWLALSLYIALFIALSVMLGRFLKDKLNIGYLFCIPLLFTVLDFVREWLFSGFPLLTIAQSQQSFAYALQLLKFTGVHGLNFLIISSNILIALIICGIIPAKQKSQPDAGAGDSVSLPQEPQPGIGKRELLKMENIIWLAITLLLLGLTYAANTNKKENFQPVKIALLQANMDQNVEWNKNYKTTTMDLFKQLITGLIKDRPELFIWSETAYPGALNMESVGAKTISGWVKGYGAFHIVGSDCVLSNEGEFKYYNSAFLISPKGMILGDYSKYHLVPLGEYVPFSDVFPVIRKVVRRYGYESFSPGKKIAPLSMGGKYFGVLICYDSLFPEISRDFVKKGAEFLVHLSYETWYGKTPASAQIFTNTALRAVENNVWMARCVESGISGIVDSRGAITLSTKLFERTAITGDIFIRRDKSRSFYTACGDWFIYVLLLVLALLAILRIAGKRKL